MGGQGVKSRLFFPALGSLVTFAFVGRPTAPSRLEFDQTFELMRLLYPDFNERKMVELGLMEGA